MALIIFSGSFFFPSLLPLPITWWGPLLSPFIYGGGKKKSNSFITVKDEWIVKSMFCFILFYFIFTQNNITDCTYFGYKNETKHLSLKKNIYVSHN